MLYAVPLQKASSDALLLGYEDFGPITGNTDESLTCAALHMGPVMERRTVGYLIRKETPHVYSYGVVLGTPEGWSPIFSKGGRGEGLALHVAALQVHFFVLPTTAMEIAGLLRPGSLRIL
jgi:hypothetical protein